MSGGSQNQQKSERVEHAGRPDGGRQILNAQEMN